MMKEKKEAKRLPRVLRAGAIAAVMTVVLAEIHTTTPDRIVLAGGSYLGEDGWCMIGYPGCDYLCFHLDENGKRTFLFSKMENDCFPGSELFREDLIRALENEGLLSPDEG